MYSPRRRYTSQEMCIDIILKRQQVLQGSTVSENSVAPPQASPATHSAKEALVGQVFTARHRAAHLQWAQRHFLLILHQNYRSLQRKRRRNIRHYVNIRFAGRQIDKG